jgi:hypothetical protein
LHSCVFNIRLANEKLFDKVGRSKIKILTKRSVRRVDMVPPIDPNLFPQLRSRVLAPRAPLGRTMNNSSFIRNWNLPPLPRFIRGRLLRWSDNDHMRTAAEEETLARNNKTLSCEFCSIVTAGYRWLGLKILELFVMTNLYRLLKKDRRNRFESRKRLLICLFDGYNCRYIREFRSENRIEARNKLSR